MNLIKIKTDAKEKFKKPKTISIDISERCNLKCRICKQWKDKNRHKKLDIKDIKKLIDQISNYFPETILEFSGQEPLLKKELLFDSLDYAKKKNIITALSTNGTLINEDTAKELIKKNLHHISVSLDGFEETHNYIRNSRNAYQNVISGLKNLLRYKKKLKSKTAIAVTTVITNKNFRELLPLYNFLNKLGVYCVNYNGYVLDNSYFFAPNEKYNNEFWIDSENIPTFSKIIDKIIELKEKDSKPTITNDISQLKIMPEYFKLKNKFNKGYCLAGSNYFHITNFGEVTVCGKGPQLNIKDNDLMEIWTSKQMQETRKKVKECKIPCLNNCFDLK
jgi:MoaA/NifB/PqqE/SkfB family radical SAM enzyme